MWDITLDCIVPKTRSCLLKNSYLLSSRIDIRCCCLAARKMMLNNFVSLLLLQLVAVVVVVVVVVFSFSDSLAALR